MGMFYLTHQSNCTNAIKTIYGTIVPIIKMSRCKKKIVDVGPPGMLFTVFYDYDHSYGTEITYACGCRY